MKWIVVAVAFFIVAQLIPVSRRNPYVDPAKTVYAERESARSSAGRVHAIVPELPL